MPPKPLLNIVAASQSFRPGDLGNQVCHAATQAALQFFRQRTSIYCTVRVL
jgi:hypothetical protein